MNDLPEPSDSELADYSAAWPLINKIDAKERELAKWFAMPEKIPSEAAIKEQRVAALKAELAALMAEYKAPHPMRIDAQPQTRATPVPMPRAASGTLIHNPTKIRRHMLKPVIEMAQASCHNPMDTAEVYAAMSVLAERKQPPLFGATAEGLQYYKGGYATIFTRDALRKQLGRQRPLSAAKRR